MHKNQETFFSRKLSEQAHTHTHKQMSHICSNNFDSTNTFEIQIIMTIQSDRPPSVYYGVIFLKFKTLFWLRQMNCLYRGEQIERIQNISSSKKIRF